MPDDYLLIVILWAVPPVVLGWLLGLDLLVRRWKVWVLGIVLPTAYLIGVVSVGLGLGIWSLDLRRLSGILIPVLNVPLEDALILFFTNALIVQTAILLREGPRLRARLRRWWGLLRSGPAAWKAGPPDEVMLR